MSICNDSLGSLRAKRKLFDESIKIEAPQPFERCPPISAEAAQSLVSFVPTDWPRAKTVLAARPAVSD